MIVYNPKRSLVNFGGVFKMSQNGEDQALTLVAA